MSAEKIVSEEQNLATLVTPQVAGKSVPGRVDINKLLARVREERKKENKLNIVFFTFFVILLFIIGIILSF